VPSYRFGALIYFLQNVSLTIAPGQRVALVGTSGAGKTTIASLIVRLYDPQQGSILIDGVNIKDYQRQSLRHQIGLVLQDSTLFGATIKENIAYGKPEATIAEIEAAAQQAHAHDFITALPEGYDTIIGEMGSTLSGGQRQRIAIARALIKRPSILIMDEPTSALDAESEALVREALTYLQQGKTTLVIAHHLAAIKDFDQILVLNNGKIVERGTHEELLTLKGHYYELFQLQDPTSA
jgi:ATP-binding cassette, subfamily B, bacterial